jgi:hypothetical protein
VNTRACGERRFGSADFWQHLIVVDTDDPRAAPLRGLRSALSVAYSKGKKFDRAKIMQRPDALLREFS